MISMAKLFLLKKKFWVTLVKVFFLLFVASMVFIQLPELLYDLSPNKPVPIDGVEDLKREGANKTIFASIEGTPNFDRAFVYQRYGLSYTYFLIEPYGMKLVARTYEKVDDDWETRTRFLGKLKPFDDQPFSYRIEKIFMDQFEEEVPDDAFFLALDDAFDVQGFQELAELLEVGFFH